MVAQNEFTNHLAPPQDPIPGYRLLERIGRGGYGEVWKALDTQGGQKAIKLVYADDSSRMSTELRSLNRVKDIQHPFLLSIERIEQHGELLVIVTELGDKNLQQHFESCRTKGLPGIPQDDLLHMMRDVADALDYIYQEYALQHLDIKPANLLVFGRRLKVADFGLVKNIYERSASLVHGLTPTYAAPEIFEGQPTRASDQYSLAILYQEMLTGVLPFNGMTAARLATQHLRETPDLRPLPPAQRPAIARALSKDPLQRHANCLELVKELSDAVRQSNSSSVAASQQRQMTAAVPAQQSFVSTVETKAHIATPSSRATERSADPSAPAFETAPTIVIGIGGAAGKALQRLRLRIGDRLAAVDKLPAFKLLYLDIDPDALNEANENHQAWSELETVPTPLHSSADYREQGQLHRRWLSRRWLCNVPRSCRTDGLRPFGRLALLSNAKRVLASLRSAIASVTSTCPGVTPRILLVASISGGTGSGMLLDVAYAVRQELRNAGSPDATVDGVLLHSTPVGSGRDKAVLNAIATLSELHHYSTSGSFYPGEPLLQTPPFHGNNRTFTSTQLLHLGDDLGGSNWLRAIDNVAELLYCRLMTNFDKPFCGDSSRSTLESPTLDLVRMQQIGGYRGSFIDDLARQLCVDVIGGWCGSDPNHNSTDRRRTPVTATLFVTAVDSSQKPKSQQLIAAAEKQLLDCGVEVDELRKCANQMLEEEIKVTQREFLQAQFADVVKSISDDVPDHEVARQVIARQDRALGLDFGESPADNIRNTLFDLLNARLATQAMPIAARYVAWVCDLIDQSTGGVDAARHAAEIGRDCLREIISVLGSGIKNQQTQQTASRIQLMQPPGPNSSAKPSRGWLRRRANPRVALCEKLIEHGLHSFEELTEVIVQLQLRAIEANILSVIDHLVSMWHELNQLGKRIGNEMTSTNPDRGHPAPYECSLQSWLLDHRPQLVQELRTRMEEDVLAGPKKLQRFLQRECPYEEVLGDPLRRHARKVVLQSIDQLLCHALQQDSNSLDKRELNIDAALAELLSEPWTCEGGESERTALVVPSIVGESAGQIRTVPDGRQIPILAARTNNVAIGQIRCHATFPQVIRSITHGQDGLMTVAANLHTRIDVEWNAPVESNKPTADSELFLGTPSSEVQQTVPLSN